MRIINSLLLSLCIVLSLTPNTIIEAAEPPVATVFDVDGNGSIEPLSDGLLTLRYLFGFRGPELINQAIGTGASRQTSNQIQTYLSDNLSEFDIDGNKVSEPLSDGLLLLRYLFGFRSNSLTDNAIGSNALRATPTEIAAYIQGNGITNPEFIRKAEAISFSQIQLYEGHVKPTDPNPIALNVGNLNSGDLITVDVEFEIIGNLDDYSLTVQLVPMDIFNRLNPGDNVGDVSSDAITEVESDRIVDLGGVYIDLIQPGLLHGVVHGKLPILENDTTYKVIVTPTLDYLVADKNALVTDAEYRSIPLLVDPRELLIHKLEEVTARIVDLPDLEEESGFTHLEIQGKFDSRGYSIKPLFETSVKVDISSFNAAEEIAISMSWNCDVQSCGTGLGYHRIHLLSSDINGDPKISRVAYFTIKQTGETIVNIPIVAFVTERTHNALLGQSTFIKNIKGSTVKTGDFVLDVKYIKNGIEVDTGIDYTLSLPLVSQDNSPKKLTVDQASGFSVLRAGPTNAACLAIGTDPDSGLLLPDGKSEVFATSCTYEYGTQDHMLWRYDESTKQLVNKIKDTEGGNHCLTARDVDIISGGNFARGIIPPSGNYVEIDIQKCEFQAFPSLPGKAIYQQQFDLVGDKIKSTINGRYLTVTDINTVTEDVELVDISESPTDFYTDTNGFEVDRSGRLFYIGDSKDLSLGNQDFAAINLSFSGESYLDYMPVIGTTTHGELLMSGSIFGASTDLVEATFRHQRYLPKKITTVIGNNAPVEVGDGAELRVSLLGSLVASKGEIVPKTVTSSYIPGVDVANTLNDEPNLVSIATLDFNPYIDAQILNTTFVVIVVPVTIEGGIEGSFNLGVDLDFKVAGSLGLATGVLGTLNMDTSLNGYVSAKADALVVAAGIEASIEFINQFLVFSADAGFKPSILGDTNKLSFDIDSDLVAELKLLKGEIIGFIEYRKVCLCKSVGKKVRKENVFYSSPYLFNKSWNLYSSGQINIFDINF